MAPSPQPNAIERTIRRLDRFQQAHGALGFPWAVLQKFGNDQAGSRAALIAYYGLFAIFPLLAPVHHHPGVRPAATTTRCARTLSTARSATFPSSAPSCSRRPTPCEGSGAALVIGAVLLLYGAFGLGQATQAGMNAVWNVPYVRRPNFVLRYARALGVLVLLALSTIGSTVLTGFATLAGHGRAATAILIVGSTLLNFVLIMAAFKVMIAAPLRLREIVLGAALAAVFWQTLQLIGSWYVGRNLQHNSDTYGFFAVVIVLLSWIYLGAQLFLLAAEINVVQPLPAVAPLHRAAAVDRCRSTGIRATDAIWRSGGPRPSCRSGSPPRRPGPAQGARNAEVEAGRSVWKPE